MGTPRWWEPEGTRAYLPSSGVCTPAGFLSLRDPRGSTKRMSEGETPVSSSPRLAAMNFAAHHTA